MTVVLVAVLLTAAIVAGGAEWWLRNHGLDRLRDQLSQRLGAPVALTVADGALVRHLVGRHVPTLTIVATGVPVADGRGAIDRLQIDLTDVRLGGWGRERRVLTAGAGTFAAHLRMTSLGDVLELPPFLARVDVAPRGLKLLTVAGVMLDATVELRRTSVLVRPLDGSRSLMRRFLPQPVFRIPLPTLPFGARIEAAELSDGAVDVRGRFDPDQLVLAVG